LRRLALSAFLALTLTLALPSVPRAAEPLTINAILSLTGYAAFVGTLEQVGLRALEDATNKSGGINGTPVHF
jgi:ABC-type branched-subunit amino acid transport system substrate-binding protein